MLFENPRSSPHNHLATDARGTSTSYTYDNLDRLTASSTAGAIVAYAYNPTTKPTGTGIAGCSPHRWRQTLCPAKSDPSKAGLKDPEPRFYCETVSEARIDEQLLISAYSLEHLRNRRREIAPNKLNDFVDEIGYLLTLYETVTESEWLEFLGK